MAVDRHTLGRLLAVALVTAVVSLFPGRVVLVRGALGLTIADGLAVAAGILFGPVGAWGTGLGYLGSALARGTVGLLTPFVAAGYVLSGYVAFALWRWVWKGSAGSQSRFRSVRQLAGLLTVVVVCSVVAAVVVGWGYEVTGAFPFYTASVLTLPGRLLASVLVATGLLAVGPFLPNEAADPTRFGSVAERPSSLAVVLVTALWYVGGTVVSVGFQVYEIVPPSEFARRGVGFLTVFGNDAIFRYGGARVQVILGSVLFVALVVAVTGTVRRIPNPFSQTST